MRVTGLKLDVHETAVAHQVQDLVERGHRGAGAGWGEAAAGVEAADFVQRGLAHRAAAVGGAFEDEIVDHHQGAVARPVHVELDAVRAQVEGGGEGGQGILWRNPARAAMGIDKRMVRHGSEREGA